MFDTDKLFAEFDPDQVNAACAARLAEIETIGESRAMHRAHQIATRRATSDAKLNELLPDLPAPDHSVHVLSTGDIDVLSFTRRIIDQLGYVDELSVATWRINADDLQQIETWLDAGIIDTFHLLVDRRFARLAPTEYAIAQRLQQQYPPSTLTLCLNHCKVTLLANAASDYWIAIESSANVNTNRRLEQTSIHHSRALHDFYATAFQHIRTRRAQTHAG